MKNLIIMLFAALTLISCEEFENSAELSKVTYLPLVEIKGEEAIELPCDATGYTDEGAVATEGGQQIELVTTVSGVYFGSSAVNQPDLYNVTYAAENKDGIPGNAVRSVFWPECNGDMVNSIAGMYTASVVRTATSGAVRDYSDEAMGPYFILDLGNNQYQLSDAIGSFYEHGPDYGYGPDYAATGMVITANNIATNSFTHDQAIGVGAFGGELKITSFSVDPLTKTIEFTSEWDFGYTFEVVLTQVN